MSEESKDQVERVDEQKGDDVEVHSLDDPDTPQATEEPPDVEGHSLDPMVDQVD